jgi:NADPH-dependent ferric siderophore reductase
MPSTRTNSDPVADFMAIAGDDVLNRINVDFEDSMIFVGRVLTGRPTARTTVVTTIDRAGVDVIVGDDEGEHQHRVEFAEPVDDPMQLTGALFELVTRARSASGEAGTTSAEREMIEMSSIRTFITTVESVGDVHPHLRLIAFSGGDLTTFSPVGPDTFLYLLVAPPGCDHLAIDQSFTWEQHGAMPDGVRPVGAYYTVRTWDAEASRLEVLAVVHGDEGAASAWAMGAAPGERVALWGPRSAYHLPQDADHLLLVADDTGLPAVAAILEQLPAGVTASVVAEVDRPEERQELPDGAGIDVHWLYRSGAAPGTTTLLVDAVRRLPRPTASTYVWGGGESRAMTAVRRYVRDEIGVGRSSVDLVAYWRR